MGMFVDLNKEVQRQELLTGKTLDENEVRQLRYNAVMREAAKDGCARRSVRRGGIAVKALGREVTELKEAVARNFRNI